MAEQSASNRGRSESDPAASGSQGTPPRFEQLEPIILLNADFTTHSVSSPDQYGQLLFARSLQRESLEHEHGLGQARQETGAYLPGGSGVGYRDGGGEGLGALPTLASAPKAGPDAAMARERSLQALDRRTDASQAAPGQPTDGTETSPSTAPAAQPGGNQNSPTNPPTGSVPGTTPQQPGGESAPTPGGFTAPPPGGPWQPTEYRQPGLDLAVIDVQSPATAARGQTITLEWTVRNVGSGTISGDGWHDAVYFSYDATYDASDTYVTSRWTREQNPMSPGSQYTYRREVEIPSAARADGYLLVLTDRWDRVPELTNANNVGASVRINLADAPDVPAPDTTIDPTPPAQPPSGYSPRTDGPGINTPLGTSQIATIEQGLQALRDTFADLAALGDWAASLPLITANDAARTPMTLGRALDLATLFDAQLITPVRTYLSQASPTSDGLVSALDTLSQTFGAVTGGLYNGGTELRFNLDFRSSRTLANLPINLGTEAGPLGLRLDANGQVTMQASVAYSFSFGIDLAAGLGDAEAFFIRSGSLAAAASIAGTNLNFTANVGVLDVSILNGSLAMNAGVSVALTNPDADALGRITLTELQGLSPASLFTVTRTTATATGTLPISATIGGYSFPGVPSITLTANPFSGAAPTLTTNSAFAEMANFKNLSPVQLLSMVDHIGTMLDNLAGTSVMSTPIPFTQGLTVGGALDFAQAFAARVTDALRDPGGVPIFDSVQTFATNLATVLGLPAGTIAPQYDPTENRFSYRLQFSRTAAVQEVPLDFSANLAPLGGVTTSSRLRVTATMNADLRVLFDVDALTSSETIFDAVLIQSASVSGSLSLALSSFSAAARFGFLDVSVGGGSATGNAAISMQMRDPVGGSTTTPVKVTTLLQRIVTDPSSIVTTPSVTGSASMSLGPISVLGGLLGPITGTPTITISLPTLTSTPTLSYNSDFNPILSFRDLDIGDVAGALSSFASYLQTLSGFSFLNYKLPFLNKTVSEMLGFAADFGTIDELVAATGTSALQTLQNALNGVLDDLPIPGSATIAFTQTPIRALRIDLSFQDQFSGTQPFNFDLATLASVDGDSLPSTIRNLVSGTGTLNANASVSLDLDLGIDLSNPLNPRPFIYDTTGLSLSAQASGTNLNFSVAAGPLGVFIRNGSVNLGPATFSVQVNDNPGGGGRWYLDSIGTGQVTMALTGTANANLPIDFPLEGVSVGAITLSMSNLGNINASTVDLTLPNFQTLINGLDLNLNMSSLVDGLDFVFTIIDGAIVVGGLASRLPIVGDDIGEAVRVIQQFKNNVINPLRTELATGNLLQTEVKSILFSALGPAGINILRDNNNAGGGGVTLDDVIVTVTDTAPADGIVDDIRFDIKIGQEANLSTGQTGFDLGLDAIGLTLDGSVNLQLGWSMNLVFGLSVAEGGAYFDLTNNRNDLTLEASATVPGFDASGHLLILEARARDNPANPTRLNASFQLDLREPPSGNGNGKLSFNELIGATPAQIVNAQFNATAHLDLLLTLRFGPDANFPSLGANLVVDWTMTNASLGSPSVAFNDITVNMGEFFSRFVGPIIEAIQTVTDPLQPVIDALTAPLPVITDLVQLVDPAAEPVTMLTLASLTGLADTQFIGAITDVLDLITIINGISVGSDVTINLGSFNLAGVGASTLRTPGALGSFSIPAANANPLSGLTQLASNPATSSFSTSNQSVEGGGLQFPFLEDPLGSLFPLLLGQDVTIFRYDAPKLAVGFEFRQSFPIIGPLVATLGGRLEAGIDVDFGYDTYGLRRTFETGNALELLNGFYIEDKVGGTASGKDKFEAYITGEIAAGGGIDIFIASAGVEGGVFATIGLDLRDPDGDGKFRFKNIIDAGSPLCVFTLGGEVGAFLRAYVEVGIWPFEVTLSFDLARVTLVTFNYDPCAEPPVLASLESSGELLLNMGPRAGLRGGEFTSDIAERFSVKRLTSYSVLVESDFGEGSQYSQTFGTEANPVLRITADGGAGDDSILIDPGIVLPTNLQGGVGHDTLQGGGGNDTIAGGDGNDTIFGNAGADILSGGIGDDSIKGGTGGDTIDGGDGNDVIVSGSDPANLDDNDSILGGLGDDNITGGLGVDTIDAGPGRDIVRGGDGNDILRGGDGPDAIYGDGGDDFIEGGDGDDYLEGGETPVESGAVAPNSGNDTIHGGAGNDKIHGRDGNDTLTGGDGDDEVYGDEGDDSIDTGAGDDAAFGGDGADTILLGAGNDSAQGGAGNDVIRGDIGNDTIDAGAGADQVFGDAGNDTIRGGDGDDVLEGGAGSDFIVGGAGNDTIRGQEDADTLSGQEGNDTIFGGGGNDAIFGGFGNDVIRGEDGADTIYGDTGDDDIRGDAGADIIYGGAGRDYIEGNADADVIRAGDGDDTVRGNAGNDTIYGEAGSDTIYGDDGDDVIEGGDGDDFLRGQLGADTIRGNAGNDFIDGGDGNDTLRGDEDDDLIYGGASGDDIIEGNAGNDRVWGESGADTISGGDGDDTLSGGTGNDVISGNAGNDQLLGDDGVDTLSGDSGNDTLIAGTGIGDSLSGGDGDDVIFGSDEGAASDPDFNDAVRFGDLISGGAGNDTIYAMGGADRVSGDGGDDRIDGGMGADLLLGGEGNDAIYAGESTGDDLRGEAGDDTIHGSFIGNDTIRGGDGNDVIFGQGGTDTIFGDAGDDIIDAGSGTDIVEGGLGDDEIDGGGGVGDSLAGNEGDDVIRGSDDGADVISGGDGRDRLFGRGGNDIISGGAGDDIIRGGTGDDVISGDAGSDLITGDEHHDTLYGHSASGAGDDNAVDYLYGDIGTNGSEPNQGRDRLVGGGGLDQLFGEGDDDVIRQGDAASSPTGPDIHVNYGSGDGATPTDFIPAAPTPAPSVQAGTPLITFGPSMAAGESTAGRFGELAGSGSRLGLSGSAGLSEDAASAAASDGSVYSAWAESQNGSFEIYVARFQGGTWTQLAGSAQGGGISATSGASRSPSIALDGTNPVVAWAETDAAGNTNIRVARWNGSAWAALGASLSTAGISGSNLAESPKVVMSGSTPVVAWIDRTGGIRNVHIRRFTGGAWQELGTGSASSDGVSNSAIDVADLSLAAGPTGRLAVAWTQSFAAQDREIYLLEWNGTSWGSLGGSVTGGGVSNNASESAQPSLAYLGDTLFVAWQDNTLDRSSILAARFSGGSWQPLGAPLGGTISGSTGRVSMPQLASTGTSLQLAWVDSTVLSRTTTRQAVHARTWNGTSFAEQLVGDARNEGVVSTSGDIRGLHLALDASGRPIVSWTDASAGRPKAFVRHNTFSLGSVYYVNDAATAGDTFSGAAGNAANPGTSAAAPAASVGQILAARDLNPGDVIVVDSGAYPAFTVGADDAGVTIIGGFYGLPAIGGTVAVNAADVTLSGLGLAAVSVGSTAARLLMQDGAATGGITIDGAADATVLRNLVGGGITLNASTTGVNIEQNRLSGGARGIHFAGDGVTGAMVRHNTITGATTGIDIAEAAGAEIVSNTLTGNATGIRVQAALTGTIAGNTVTGGTVGLRYNAAANVVANTFSGATTGALVSTSTQAAGLGFVGTGTANVFTGGSVGVELNGWMQGQTIRGNTTGVIGTGLLGPESSLDLANRIESNTVGTVFAGVIRFNRISLNGTGIDASASQVVVHNLIYRNAADGVDIEATADVRIVNNTIDAWTGNAVRARGASSQLEVRGNILWADAGYALTVDNTSQSGFFSDRNTLFSTGTGKIAYWTKDFNDILDFRADVARFDLTSQGRTAVDPLWAQPRFQNRTAGNYQVFDIVAGRRFSSPTVDMGDVTADQGVPIDRVNLLQNPSFESGLSSWTVNLGSSVRTNSPSPHVGSGYFQPGNDAAGFAEQTVSLLTAGYTPAALDSQDLVLVFGGRIRSAAESAADRGQFIVRFLDGGGSELSFQSLPASNVSDRWELLGSRVAIPSGARSVVYRFVASRESGSTTDSYLDAGFAYVMPESFGADQGAYGNTVADAAAASTRIVLIAPDLYADWERNRPQTIIWNSFGNAADLGVNIDLFRDGPDGPAFVLNIALNTPDVGSFQWQPGTSGVDFGTYGLRIQVSLAGNAAIVDRGTEAFTVPEDGTTYYVDDASNVNDEYTPGATGNNRATGKLPTAPKPNPVNVIRTYELQNSSTLHVDTGVYPLIDTFVASGVTGAGYGTDRAFSLLGPVSADRTAEFTTAIPGNTNQSLVQLFDADFMQIRRLTLTGGRHAINARSGSTDLTLDTVVARDNAADGVRIEGGSAFTLIRNLTATNHPGTSDGLAVSGGGGGVIENLVASGNRFGLYLNDVGVTINGATLTGNRSFGLYKDGGTAGGTWTGVTATSNAGGGLRTEGNVTIANATITGNSGWGVLQWYSTITVSDSILSGNTAGGMLVMDGSFTGNRLLNNGGPGIQLQYYGAGSILGNTFSGNAWGIYADTWSSQPLTIRNNTMSGHANAAIRILNMSGAASRQIVNNTIDEATADGIRVSNSRDITLRNNIVWVRTGYGVYIENDSQLGFQTNFNLLRATDRGRTGFYQGDRVSLTDWQFATFQDADSLSADPLFVNPAAGNFRLQSVHGSYDPATGTFIANALTSPAIDRGSPADAFNLEPTSNGGYINLGAEGNTVQASRSPAQYVTVTNPNGGETLPQNTTFNVRWRSFGFAGNVDIAVSRNGPGGPFTVIAANEANDGSYSWNLTGAPISDQYVLRITSSGTPAIGDASDALFSVGVPISVYYVDDSSDANDEFTPGAVGNDANTGQSPLSPKASIRAVLQQYDLEFGDVIYVDTGTYQLTANILIEAQDAGVRIVGPSSGPGAVIDRNNRTSASQRAFELVNADAVTISRLRITGAFYGVFLDGGSSGVTLDNVEIFENADRGIQVNDNASANFTLRDSFLWGNAVDGNRNQDYNAVIHGVNSTVLRNRFTKINGRDGYGLYIDAPGTAIVQDNQAWNNTHGMYIRGDGFEVSGNSTFQNNDRGLWLNGNSTAGYATPTAFNNTSFANGGDGFHVDNRVLIRDSVAYANGQEGLEIRNGASADRLTLYRNGGPSHASVYGYSAGSITNLNIFNANYGIYADGYSNVLIQGNRIHGVSSYGIAVNNWAAYNYRILNNLVYDAGEGILVGDGSTSNNVDNDIINNTVYTPAGDAVRFAGNTRNVTLKNNILVAGGTGKYVVNVADSAQTGFASDYNLLRPINGASLGYWQLPFATLTDWSLELGLDANSISADPRFVDIDGADDVLGAVDAGGLTFEGWNNTTFSGTPAVTGVDRSVEFNTGSGIRPGLNVDGTSMRWSGEVFLPAAGTYTFDIRAYGPQRLFVNGTLVVNDFSPPANQESRTGTFVATGPGWVPIVFEAVDDTSTTAPRLRWSRPGDGTMFTTISSAYLRTSAAALVDGSDDNFRLQSTVASFKPGTGTWTPDAAFSPAIDAGDPADAVTEDTPTGLSGPLALQDGDRVDLGAYGNSNQASRSRASYIQLLTPGNSAKFIGGQLISVTWRSAGLSGFVDIGYTTDDGATVTPLGAGVDDDGEFSFSLDPATPLTNIRIVIADAADPFINAMSVVPFSVGVITTTYYVNDDAAGDDVFTSAVGSNANTGTSAADPMRSLSALLAAYDLEPGDTVRVDTGTYQLIRNILVTSDDAGITFEGPSSGPGAVIDRNNRTSASQRAFELINADAVTISRLRITGAFYGVFLDGGSSGVTLDNVEIFENADRGIQVNDNASANFTLRDSFLWGNAADGNRNQDYNAVIHGVNATVLRNRFTKINGRDGYGLYIDAPGTAIVQDNQAWNNTHGMYIRGDGFEVSGNSTFQNNDRGLWLNGNSTAGYATPTAFNNTSFANRGEGFYVDNRVLIRDSVAYSNGEEGLEIRNGASADRLTLYRNGGPNHASVVAYSAGSITNLNIFNANYGIYADGYSNVLIQGNRIHGVSSYGIAVNNYAAYNYRILNNLVYDAGEGILVSDGSTSNNVDNDIINNTVYTPAGDAVRFAGNTRNVTLKNNILVAGGTGKYVVNVADSAQTGFASDYNLLRPINGASLGYWQLPFATLTDWSLELGLDANSISADPRFVDIDGADDVLGAVDAGGLTFEGWNNTTFSGTPAVTGVDRSVEFNTGSGIRPGLNVDGTSMRWSGEVFLPAAGTYTFDIRAYGPQRLFVNGTLVVNDFSPPANQESRTGTFVATGPGWVPIVFEAVDDTSTTAPRLRWSKPGDGTMFTTIGSAYLRTSAAALVDGSDDNFRLQSTVASYKPGTGTWTPDAAFSPAIDAGDPVDAVTEDTPTGLSGPLALQDGDRVDLGAYGNSNQASRSQANFVQILSPDGGEKAKAGRSMLVRWRSVNAGARVNIEFSPNNGASWTTIAANEINDGSYAWTPNNTHRTLDGLIRITSTTNASATDTSVNVFTVGSSGSTYYVNDDATTGDQYATAVGNNLNTGTTPGDPMRSLNALLAAYDLNPGDVVRVDTGTYLLASTVEVLAQDAGVSILGPVGGGATLQRSNVATNIAAMRVAASDVSVRNLTLSNGYFGLWAAGAPRLTIEDVRAVDNAFIGLYLDSGSSNAVLRRVVAFGTTSSPNTDQDIDVRIDGTNALVEISQFYKVGSRSGTGFRAEASASGLTFRDNIAYNNSTGISISVAQFTALRNEARGNDTGMDLNDTADLDYSTVSNNLVTENTTGVRVRDRINFRDNTVSLNAGFGVYGENSNYSHVRNNLISLNGDGVRAYAMWVEGNRIVGNVNRGVYVDQYPSVTIERNRILGSSVGIRLENMYSGQPLIVNNLIYDHTNQAIDVNLSASSSPSFRIINNTIFHQVGSAIRVTNATAASQIINNMVAIGGGYGFEFSGIAGGFTSNFNNVWLTNPGAAQFGRSSGTPRNDLAEWRTATGLDSVSKSADPLFIDFNGADNLLGWDRLSPGDPFSDFGLDDNFRIRSTSPLIDAANSTVAPALDADGLPRNDDLGTTNTGEGVFRFYDIGAYEFQGSGNDTTPPVITAFSPAGMVDDAVLTTSVSSFTMTFSERMDVTSVRSLSLYTLTEAGADGLFGSGDDVPMSISDVTYGFGEFNATVVLPGSLSDGRYRFRILSDSTNAPVDLAGNRLDGNLDGAEAGDFARTFRVDRTGPTVASVSPSGVVNVGPAAFSIQFAPATDLVASSLTNPANYTLLRSVDATFGNGDDTNISSRIVTILFNSSTSLVTLTLDAPLDNANYRLLLGAGIVDASGNPLAGAPVAANLTVDSVRPVATLAAPFNAPIVGADVGYVDIAWNDTNGSGVNPASVAAGSVTITGVTVTGVSSMGGSIFRYAYSGSLPQGVVTVSAAAGAATDLAGNVSLAATVGSFVLDTVAPTGSLEAPLAGSTISNNPGFVDIRWTDGTGSGIDPATIDAADITITGVSVTGVSSLGAGFWRYSYAGTLPLGAISVGVAANQVRDLAGRAVAAGVLGSFTRVDGRPAVTGYSIDVHGRTLTIDFSNATNLQTLITNGQITTAVQLTARQGAIDVPVALAATRFSWNPVARRLTIDLRHDLSDPFSRSMLPAPSSFFRLSLSTTLINNGVGNPLQDDDGVGDGFRRTIFSWTPPAELPAELD